MSAEEFYWSEALLVVGGVALVAFLQADFIAPKVSHLTWTWMVHAFFGVIYALIGSATTFMAVTRHGRSKTLRRDARTHPLKNDRFGDA